MLRTLQFNGSRSLLAVTVILISTFFINDVNSFAQRRTKSTASGSTNNRTVTIRSEPNCIIWIDEIRRGVTDKSGILVLKSVSNGRHLLRLRAIGFKEVTLTLSPAKGGVQDVRLVRSTDEAELTFQRAEAARESSRDDGERNSAVALYRTAIKLRSNYAAAHLGLARTLLDLNDYNSALEEVEAARASRRIYPEASAVEGRILRMAADEAAAIVAFKRSIAEAKGFQPEAHTGLALVYQDKGMYDEAALEFRKAVSQLSDTEPIIYQLLGAVYEKQEKYKEAVAAYEKYLELAPDGSLAPAIRSVMDQLRNQAEGRSGLPY